MKSLRIRRALAVLCLSLGAVGAWAQSAPQAKEAWARATPAGVANAGGYVTLVGAAAGDRLLAASADIAASTELHLMRMDGDIMRMRQVEAIEVPAGKTVKLEPGGLHIMFMGLKAPLKAGEKFALRLRFEKGGEATVQVLVRADAPGGHGHKH